MKKSLLVAAALVFLPFSVSAQEFTPYEQLPAGTYQLDKNHASLNWRVSHVGLSNYTARFTDIDATVDFNPQDITRSRVTVTVNPRSIETDFTPTEDKDFNAKLAHDPAWFNAEQFPEIRFVSTRIEKTGENTGRIHGDLTMLGKTKPVVLDATLNGAFEKQPFTQLPTLGVSATATIKRSEWGFDTYVPAIGDEVTLLIETEFFKQD